MPFDWTAVFIVFAIVCLIEYAIWRREASGNDLRRKSRDFGSEGPPQDPPTSSRAERPSGLVKPPPSAQDKDRQDETSVLINDTDHPQVTHPEDGQLSKQSTEASLKRAASETEGTKDVHDDSDCSSLVSGPSIQLREVPAVNLYNIDADTVVCGPDPSNDSDDNRSWSLSDQHGLLHFYSDNEDWDIADLARHFGTTSRSVVITLMFLLLEPHGPIEDPHCPKWRKPWTQKEVDDVHDLFRAGAALPGIAQATGRDQLSVAFRLFRDRLPEADGAVNDLPIM